MNVKMRSMLLTTMAGAAALAAAATAYALATNSVDVDERGALVVDFSDVVGGSATPYYTLRYNVSAEFMCATGSADPLTLAEWARTTSASGSAHMDVSPDVNGSVSATLSSNVPQPPSSLHCPSGYSARLRLVRYTNTLLRRTGRDVPDTEMSVSNASREFFLPRTH